MKHTLHVVAQGDREIVMTRSFDAPKALVWDALTKPELLKRWFGTRGEFELAVCDIDLRVGGKYRYEWRGPNNYTMGMSGEYLEVRKLERIVATEVFDEPWYPGGGVGTLEFIEKDGVTTLRTTVRYDSASARDGVLKSPMEKGVAARYDALERLLAQQRVSS